MDQINQSSHVRKGLQHCVSDGLLPHSGWCMLPPIHHCTVVGQTVRSAANMDNAREVDHDLYVDAAYCDCLTIYDTLSFFLFFFTVHYHYY